jgi:hypothetical protein
MFTKNEEIAHHMLQWHRGFFFDPWQSANRNFRQTRFPIFHILHEQGASGTEDFGAFFSRSPILRIHGKGTLGMREVDFFQDAFALNADEQNLATAI